MLFENINTQAEINALVDSTEQELEEIEYNARNGIISEDEASRLISALQYKLDNIKIQQENLARGRKNTDIYEKNEIASREQMGVYFDLELQTELTRLERNVSDPTLTSNDYYGIGAEDRLKAWEYEKKQCKEIQDNLVNEIWGQYNITTDNLNAFLDVYNKEIDLELEQVRQWRYNSPKYDENLTKIYLTGGIDTDEFVKRSEVQIEQIREYNNLWKIYFDSMNSYKHSAMQYEEQGDLYAAVEDYKTHIYYCINSDIFNEIYHFSHAVERLCMCYRKIKEHQLEITLIILIFRYYYLRRSNIKKLHKRLISANKLYTKDNKYSNAEKPTTKAVLLQEPKCNTVSITEKHIDIKDFIIEQKKKISDCKIKDNIQDLILEYETLIKCVLKAPINIQDIYPEVDELCAIYQTQNLVNEETNLLNNIVRLENDSIYERTSDDSTTYLTKFKGRYQDLRKNILGL